MFILLMFIEKDKLIFPLTKYYHFEVSESIFFFKEN